MARRHNLNREWKFVRGDVAGAEAVTFYDSSWEPVGLPHTFDLPYFRTPDFYVGVGWYRKHFRVHTEQRDRVFLEFDGVFQVAEVFVNGTRVGTHRGGYTGFCIDVTDAIVAGENVLAVRVNNNWDPQLAPRAGEHIFSGGIYRDVHLFTTDAMHVTWNGVWITTPRVSATEAQVHVAVEIRNDSLRDLVRIETRILDPSGREVIRGRSGDHLAPGHSRIFEHDVGPVSNPILWHPDHPYLYGAQVRVYGGKKLVDLYSCTFGIRSLRWTADRGFFLNGEHLYLRGANVHQDHAGWGIAVTRAGCERDVRLMKEAGFNFIRGAHYPHHPAFADACDRLGMLFWSENCFWGKGGFGPEGYWNASAYPVNEADFAPFEQSCKQQLAEMIRINRNHPSIIAWSMTNEAFFTYNLDRARALMRDLVSLSRELDPTRPAAIGGAQRGDVDHIGDIAGYNGDGARLFINPGVPNMVSEYGAISKHHDAYDPFFGEKQSEQFPWRSGEAIWAGFDYGSIAGRQGLKGIVDHFRLPKRSWHWYRDHYAKGRTSNIEHRTLNVQSGEPRQASIEHSMFDVECSMFSDSTPALLELRSDRTTIDGTDAIEDAHVIVTVHDAQGRRVNANPPVTLTIESGPGEFPTGRAITFAPDSDIQIIQGRAGIEFRSYHGGETTIRATSPGLADATITITTTGDPAFVPGVTPPAKSRPYTPPPESQAARAAMRNAVNVALNRPCRASSEEPDHPARFANDGDRGTSWKSRDPLGEWTLDLEGFYQLASLRLVFGIEGKFRFIVEVSADSRSWTMSIDRSASENLRAERNDVFDPGTVARYVRIRLVHVPRGEVAQVAEVEILGVLSVR